MNLTDGKYLKLNHPAQFKVQCPYCMVKPPVPCKITWQNGIHLERIIKAVADQNNLIYFRPQNN